MRAPAQATVVVSGLAWKGNAQAQAAWLEWRELAGRLPGLNPKQARVTNLDTGQKAKARLMFGDDRRPKTLVVELTATGRLPAVALRIENAACAAEASVGQELEATTLASPAPGTRIDWLTPATTYAAEHAAPLSWARTIADSVMAFHPDPKSLGSWGYESGFMADAIYELGERTGEAKYKAYAKAWLDGLLSDDGKIDPRGYRPDEYQLDNILPGRLALTLYEKTGEAKYRRAAEELLDQMKAQPRTPEGGFWHKKKYTQQMWLDGIYMGDVFLAQAGRALRRSDLTAEAARQAELIHDRALDAKTGLLYHGWDSAIQQKWANPKTGDSPEFWGRAIGWYTMAVADILDEMPKGEPQAARLAAILRGLATSLPRFQDPATGLWFQVVDKGDRPDNWPESSCTAMFGYAMAKGARRGWLDAPALDVARKAWRGLLANEVFVDEQGRVWLLGTVRVGSLTATTDYAYYVGVPRRPNDLKGVAALLYLAMEIEEAN
jgi:unsaturated rhamnogalacturonyl hydrolase